MGCCIIVSDGLSYNWPVSTLVLPTYQINLIYVIQNDAEYILKTHLSLNLSIDAK